MWLLMHNENVEIDKILSLTLSIAKFWQKRDENITNGIADM